MKLEILLSTAAVLATCAYAGDLKIIANPGVNLTSVSVDELKRIFLITKTTFDDGSRAEPVLAKGGATHETFVRAYLGKTDSALETYYRSLVFTGKGSMPKMFASEAEVVAYVAKTKGAVGYVSAGASPSGVKVLDVK